jgi:ABC-type Zn2+ transport system substrate-binding protein/surface adhesin
VTEIVFQVEEDPDGGLTAHAVGASIFTEADTLEELREKVRDAVTCHFEKPEERPKLVRLHFTRDEVIAL